MRQRLATIARDFPSNDSVTTMSEFATQTDLGDVKLVKKPNTGEFEKSRGQRPVELTGTALQSPFMGPFWTE